MFLPTSRTAESARSWKRRYADRRQRPADRPRALRSATIVTDDQIGIRPYPRAASRELVAPAMRRSRRAIALALPMRGELVRKGHAHGRWTSTGALLEMPPLIMRRRVLFVALPAAFLAGRAKAQSLPPVLPLELVRYSSQTLSGTAASLFADKAAALLPDTFQIKLAEQPPTVPFAAIGKGSAFASYYAPAFAADEPVLGLSAVPMLAASFDEAEALLRTARPHYAAALARRGQVLLAVRAVAAGGAVEHLPPPLGRRSPRRPVRAGRDALCRQRMGGAVHPAGRRARRLRRGRGGAVRRLHLEPGRWPASSPASPKSSSPSSSPS